MFPQDGAGTNVFGWIPKGPGVLSFRGSADPVDAVTSRRRRDPRLAYRGAWLVHGISSTVGGSRDGRPSTSSLLRGPELIVNKKKTNFFGSWMKHLNLSDACTGGPFPQQRKYPLQSRFSWRVTSPGFRGA